MTTLQPRPPYSAEELARHYPASLELQQVQLLMRHGERTPVSARFQNAGLPAYWPYCRAASSLRSFIIGSDGSSDTLAWRRRLESFGENDEPKLNAGSKGEVDSICLFGELTDRGRETTLALGQRLRKLYIDQLGFMPTLLDASSSDSVIMRSTPIPRAQESVQQAFTGLYPPTTRSSEIPPPALVTRAMGDETLFPNEAACKRFRELAHAFADRTAMLYNSGPELAYMTKKIGKWMPQDSPVVKVDSHPRLTGIMDTVNSTLAHGSATRLPSEFYDHKLLEHMDRITTEEWFIGYQENNEYRKLGVGAMVGGLVQRMVEHANGINTSNEGRFKMSLLGCHDTTVAGLLTSLGAFEVGKDKWPKYTSSIAIELFKHKGTSSATDNSTTSGGIWPSKEKTWWYSLFSSPVTSKPTSARKPIVEMTASEKHKLDDYYVRLRYNDQSVKIPFCKPVERHLEGDDSFCTLAAFKEAADSFTSKDWKAECKMNLGSPTTGGVIERPAGI